MNMHTIKPIQPKPYKGRYGITEAKKAEIDSLTLQVLNAQHNVEMYQSIVNALSEKANNFESLLAAADTTRTQAFNNKNMVTQLVQGAKDLMDSSNTACVEIENTQNQMQEVTAQVKTMLDRLIYSLELINKLGSVIIRKKALNPLISDDLVSMVGVAGTDGNNVIALALTALKSTFAAQASIMESDKAVELGYLQAQQLYYLLTGTAKNGAVAEKASLMSLINEAYSNARKNYTYMEKAVAITNNQLNAARADLNKAQISLKSSQSGLAAANAAAMAS